MSLERRFEDELPGLLEDLYMGAMPRYRDRLLQQTARTRQRPAWSFLERWVPMIDIAREPVFAPRVSWRIVGLGIVILALLLALVAALAGGGPTHLPAPFGPARNGLIAYASAGDIYTVDPRTGVSTAIVKGPEQDINPRWSRDGTQLAFERKTNGDSSAGFVFIARADGSNLVQVTPRPLSNISNYDFSPDGTELLIAADVEAPGAGGVGPATEPGILIAATDGTRIRQVRLETPATDASWRPPAGREILYMDRADPGSGDGSILVVDAESGSVRTVVPSSTAAGRYRGHPTWSPDGNLIAYGEWRGVNGLDVQVHIVRADGTKGRVLPSAPGAVWQAPESWSNDGTRLLVIRGYTDGVDQARPVVIPVDGSGLGIEIAYPEAVSPTDPVTWEWAPDDKSIVGTPADSSGTLVGDQVVLDPVAGTSHPAPWSSISRPSWQRLAP